ncbi:MAG: hypothetical protein GX595_19970 [Lentisphaerae bacterium]|nr:hypothetical protein [Lentisphaerota bacterium]
MRRLPYILAALLMALASAWGQAPRTAPDRGRQEATKAPEKPKSQAEKEADRLAAIGEWGKRTGATPEQIQARIFGPIVAGNAADYDKNRAMAASLNQQAEAAGKDGDAATARKYRALSDLFTECAKENRAFVTAYKGGNMRAAKEALMKLRTYDDRIAQLAGQRVQRSWHALETMVALWGLSEQEAEQWAQQQIFGAPATPGAPNTPPSPQTRR